MEIEAKGLIKRLEDIETPYPKNVFTHITREEWEKIHKIISKKLGFPLDRLSGNLMGMGWDIAKQRLILEVQEFIQEQREDKEVK